MANEISAKKLMINTSNCLYTSQFCEENIWHLCQQICADGNFTQSEVIFLSNTNKQIAVYSQQAVPAHQAIIWDYHVILKTNYQNKTVIFDFDSRLSFPCLINDYLSNSLPAHIPSQFKTQFRLISAELYLTHFFSDRSHMIDLIDKAKFPPYAPILSNHKNNLKLLQLIDFNRPIQGTRISNNLI